jgi:hypothetical protein
MLQPARFQNITTATTTTVKSGAGKLGAVIVNRPIASSTITMYDNTAASGTVIGTITLPATLLTDGPVYAEYGLNFGTGLTIDTTGTSDITVTFN